MGKRGKKKRIKEEKEEREKGKRWKGDKGERRKWEKKNSGKEEKGEKKKIVNRETLGKAEWCLSKCLVGLEPPSLYQNGAPVYIYKKQNAYLLTYRYSKSTEHYESSPKEGEREVRYSIILRRKMLGREQVKKVRCRYLGRYSMSKSQGLCACVGVAYVCTVFSGQTTIIYSTIW